MPAAGSTLTTFDAFLKDNYTTDEIARTMNQDHVFLDMLDTKKRGTGRRWIVPLIDGNPQGVGPTLPDAQAGSQQAGNGSNIQGVDWTVNWGDYSGAVQIGDKVIDASASDIGAFFEDQKEEIDGLYRTFADVMTYYLLQDQGRGLGYGSIAAGVITLAASANGILGAQAIVNFEVGQILLPSANDGTSTAHVIIAAAGLGFVVAVNYNAGTVTVSATSGGAAGTPANWTGNMYFFRAGVSTGPGDFGGTVTPNRSLLGYGAWNPPTDPTATLFEGVDRSINVLRRSGVRLVAADVTGLGIEQRCRKLATRMRSRGKAPSKGLLHSEQFEALCTSLETRGLRNLVEMQQVGYFSFGGIKMNTAAGPVGFFEDKFMPIGSLYLFDLKGIRFATLSGFPKIINGDGLTMLRAVNSNSYEYRVQAYPGYAHRDPPMTGRCPLLVPS